MVMVVVISSVGLRALVVSARRFIPSWLVFDFFLSVMMSPLLRHSVFQRIRWFWLSVLSNHFLTSEPSLYHFFTYAVIIILFIVTFTGLITLDKFKSLRRIGRCCTVHARTQARPHFGIDLSLTVMIIGSKAHLWALSCSKCPNVVRKLEQVWTGTF